MPVHPFVSLLPVLRPLVVASTLLLTLLLTAKTAISATISTPRKLAASAASLTFGNIRVNNSLTQFETLTNTGASAVTVSRATVTGPGFGVRGLTLPVTLNRGQSVTFRVLCTPGKTGPMTGKIAVVSTAPTMTIPLAAAGIPSGKLLSSTSALNFGGVAVGASKSVTGRLTASGASVTISSATTTSSEFSLSGLSLPRTLASGQSVAYTLTFRPQSSGTTSGTIALGSNASNRSLAHSLTGSGTSANGSHAVSLRWSPSSSSVVGYNVYRSSAPGGPYTKISTVAKASTGYVDRSVVGGRTYYYVSTAIKSGGVESQYSNQMRAVIPAP
jgi:hypothetical protein